MTTTEKLGIGIGLIGGVLALYFLATRKPSGGQVFGKVVDEMGEPLRGVIVRFTWYVDGEEWYRDAVTDAYGLFIRDGLPVGQHTVSFIKTFYTTTNRTVTVTLEHAVGLGTIVMYSVGPT